MTADADRARDWLAARGVTRHVDGSWSGRTPWDRPLHTANDVAHAWTEVALEDPGLDEEGRLRLALGLLDVLDDYVVTKEIHWAVDEAADPGLVRLMWDAYLRRLEAPEPAEPVRYSLWVDWFEKKETVVGAFAVVLGDDVAAGRDLAVDPLRRRAARVLEISGPVPWQLKFPVYEAAAAVPRLHPALLRGLLTCYVDVYGSLEPAAGLTLLNALELPAQTEHLARLKALFAAGHVNHYRSPGAWDAAG